jgi:hypothetical protein
LLRHTALRSWRQGTEWSRTCQSRAVGARTQLARSVAQSIIREKPVGPEKVMACVVILSVTGNWSHLSEPGPLLCSIEKYEDDTQLALELKGALNPDSIAHLTKVPKRITRHDTYQHAWCRAGAHNIRLENQPLAALIEVANVTFASRSHVRSGGVRV